jgi:hypothetical protein
MDVLCAEVSVALLMSAMSVATGIDFGTTSLFLVLGIFFQNFRTSHILVLGPFKNLDHFQWCSVCNPAKYFSHPSVVIFFFPTPPIKLQLWFANGWEPTNSKPPRPIIMIQKHIYSETMSSRQIIFITLFSGRC